MSKLINRRDLDFLLYEFLDIEQLCHRPRFTEHDRETFDFAIDTAHAIAINEFETHAAKVDMCEPEFDGEHVHIIPEVKKALDAYSDAGFMAATFDANLGGMQLPWTVGQACSALFYSANVATSAYALLTVAAANMLNEFGSEEEKSLYMEPMLQGRFLGTMCLSEPQAGSSLSDIRTQAEPSGEAHYCINGSKMWISAGEHTLSENIVHLVLARIKGAPAGVKGISLFVVPKFRVNKDGILGGRNNITLAGLNHKMGYRGTVNTVLNFGESGECRGYLLGEAHRGLSYMFHMMNEARIGIGLGATMLGYTGYLHSLEYARERPQGRHPQNKDPATKQVMIVEHADIKRLLLTQKSYVEGALALCLYCAFLVDQKNNTDSEEERGQLTLLLDILTPIAKSWPAEFCLEANKHAMQILGGYGYTKDYPLERFYRDNRLNAIHEGTHGIQAIDLLGRKVPMQDGAAFKLLLTKMRQTVTQAQAVTETSAYGEDLTKALFEVEHATEILTKASTQGQITLSLANAGIYLDMLGHLVIAWIWLRQALVIVKHSATSTKADKYFNEGKLRACHYFYLYELPKVGRQAQLLSKLDESCMTMPERSF